MVNINSDVSERTRNKEVAENIKKQITRFHVIKPGKHVLKYWMVDASVVLQKLVLIPAGKGKLSGTRRRAVSRKRFIVSSKGNK